MSRRQEKLETTWKFSAGTERVLPGDIKFCSARCQHEAFSELPRIVARSSDDIRAICARRVRATNGIPRGSLTTSERKQVWAKTGGTCHVCGGRVGKRWEVDHVIPPHLGGTRSLDNYLPI